MNESPHRRRYALIGGILVLVTLAIGVQRMTHPSQGKEAKGKAASAPIQVSTSPVAVRDVPLYSTGIGTVAALASVTVKARVDGQLDQVGFVEGQDVKAGQMLARLDPRTLQAQLGQAQGQLAKDQAQLANARVDLQRYATLIGEDAATRQQLDTQKALVGQLEAALKSDEAQVNYAQVQLSFATITAPISGRTGARLVDPGNIVHAADANGLVVINQIDPISVVFRLPEEVVQSVNQARQASRQPLQVVAFARDGSTELGKGQLILLNNQIDTGTGMVQLKGSFPNPKGLLWPGQFVNVRLVLGERAKALTMPDAAVQRGNDGLYAYVVGADRKARKQAIQVAQIQDGIAVIDRGLQAGERVVVAGQYKLKPGADTVESHPGQAASPAASGASQ